MATTSPTSSHIGGGDGGRRDGHPKRKLISCACDACRSLKAKCDGGRPSCSRCREKGSHCTYATDEGQTRHEALHVQLGKYQEIVEMLFGKADDAQLKAIATELRDNVGEPDPTTALLQSSRLFAHGMELRGFLTDSSQSYSGTDDYHGESRRRRPVSESMSASEPAWSPIPHADDQTPALFPTQNTPLQGPSPSAGPFDPNVQYAGPERMTEWYPGVQSDQIAGSWPMFQPQYGLVMPNVPQFDQMSSQPAYNHFLAQSGSGDFIAGLTDTASYMSLASGQRHGRSTSIAQGQRDEGRGSYPSRGEARGNRRPPKR